MERVIMDPKTKTALKFIRNGLKKYRYVATLSSWGKDSLVVMDLVRQVNPTIPVIFVDTTFKPKPTYDLMNKIVREWGIKLLVYKSKLLNDELTMKNIVLTPKLWETNPDDCCRIFKVEPMQRAVKELKLDAWFSGLRATESTQRKRFKKTHKQDGFVRLHPIHDWTESDVWRYMACHKLPVHPWYCLGYRSLGCKQCSSIGGASERDGRWKNTEKQGCGCGIHEVPMVK